VNYVRDMRDNGYNENTIPPYDKFVFPYIVRELCGCGKDAAILDAGAGVGNVLLPLQNEGYSDLYALDIEDTMSSFFESRKIPFSLKNLATDTLDYGDSTFDAVFNKNVIEHLPDPSKMLSEFRRVIKPGGKIILITDDWRKTYKTFYRDPTHIRPYDMESIERLLRMHGFDVSYKSSFLSKFGFGRTGLYKLFPSLAFIGDFMIIIGVKRA